MGIASKVLQGGCFHFTLEWQIEGSVQSYVFAIPTVAIPHTSLGNFASQESYIFPHSLCRNCAERSGDDESTQELCREM